MPLFVVVLVMVLFINLLNIEQQTPFIFKWIKMGLLPFLAFY